ncbi:MAG: class I adenylate-forming enzyme family protein [Candidatus Aureabacteria bacterium]|nr:class I adenylate-forming enzyme family protein [Candidatus Auribacterota bacterium]
MLGAIAVPLDFFLAEEEVAAFLNHAEPRVLITTSRGRINVGRLAARASSRLRLVTVDNDPRLSSDFWGLLPRDPSGLNEIPLSEDDLAAIFYTSGSTGRPKGALWNRRHLHLGADAAQEAIGIDETFKSLAAIPFSHSAGILYPALAVRYGMQFVIQERFSPMEFVRCIERRKITNIWLVPSMFYAILTLKGLESCDLTSLRWVDFFGAPSDPEVIRRFKKLCPQAKLTNGWGMTETAPPLTVSDPDDVASVGKVRSRAEVRIVDLEDRGRPMGEVGEIAVRGEAVCLGYYREPELTAQVFRNGWLHTGDLGRFDEKGNLYIVGRIKDVIKVAGEIVVASEIELVLLRHPCVMEAAVIGVPDPLRGQSPKAFVVLKEGAAASREELASYCRKSLAHFKIPRVFEFRKSLPKTGPGKIDKLSLAGETGE